MQDHEAPKAPAARSSECAAASLRSEIEHVGQMSVEQRILAALGMKAKFDWLQPAPVKGADG